MLSHKALKVSTAGAGVEGGSHNNELEQEVFHRLEGFPAHELTHTERAQRCGSCGELSPSG